MKLLDLFSGIGGFHKGFEKAGFEFDWVGFSDIDKYASAVYKYRYPDAKELGDITSIRPERDLPDHIDILCGGFPCQAFSQSGLRKGFKDIRGTLFFEIARILRHFRDTEKPIPYFVLENVKGLLSHDDGRTFAIIYRVLTDIGYTVECQLLNTRWVLPQNRERIYIVGHFGRGSGCKVFPIGEDGSNYRTNKINVIGTTLNTGAKGTNSRHWVYDNDGLLGALSATDYKQPKQIKIPEATKKGYAEAKVGDSIKLSVPNSKTRRGRVGKGEAQTLDTGMQKYTIDKTAIRRLTPVECMRLQGFPDDWNEKGMMDGKVVDMSDTQRYKQAGNAVSVPIVSMVAERIKDASN